MRIPDTDQAYWLAVAPIIADDSRLKEVVRWMLSEAPLQPGEVDAMSDAVAAVAEHFGVPDAYSDCMDEALNICEINLRDAD